MTDKLETFIDDHIREFDTIELPQDLWLKINGHIKAKSKKVVKRRVLSKLIYFILSVTVIVAIIYFVSQNSNGTGSIKSNEKPKESILKDAAMFTTILNDQSDKNILKQHQTISKKSDSFDKCSLSNLKSAGSSDNKRDTTVSNILKQNLGHTDSCMITEIYQTYPNKIFWVTKNEVFQFPFITEQFHWNKWIKVGKIPCKGKPDGYRYMVKVPVYSGENIFRIVQINDSNVYVTVSKEIKWDSDKPKIDYTVKKIGKEIRFSDITSYEILDTTGTVIKEGKGKIVSYKNLPKGTYVLNYDNYTVSIKH